MLADALFMEGTTSFRWPDLVMKGYEAARRDAGGKSMIKNTVGDLKKSIRR